MMKNKNLGFDMAAPQALPATTSEQPKAKRSSFRVSKLCLLLLTLLWVPIFLIAQTNGSVVLISDGSNYLSTNSNNAIVNLTTPSEYSLWYCTRTGNSCTFCSVKTGRFLRYNWGSLNASTSSTTFTLNGSNLTYSNLFSDLYLFLNNSTWNLSYNDKSDLIFTNVGQPKITATPTSLNFPVTGGTQSVSFKITKQFSWNGVKWNINSSVSVSLKNNYSKHFSVSTSGKVITVTASDNKNQAPKNTDVVVETDYGCQLSIPVQQASDLKFSHQLGRSNRPAINTFNMQGVHTEHLVYYVAQNGTVKLSVPESSFAYSRWYDFQTDATVTSNMTTPSDYQPVLGSKGVYKKTPSVGVPTYTNRSSQTSGVVAQIACDLSNYVDYTVTNEILIKEPTLSQRVIFEIRPAAEMASQLDSCSASADKYLEVYNIVAPVGRQLRIGPKYTYTGNHNNYYYTTSNGQISAIGSAIWQSKSDVAGSSVTTITGALQNDRVMAIPIVNTPQTVTYTLTGDGYGIAKFVVTYKNLLEVGPVKANATTHVAIKGETELNDKYKFITGLYFDDDPDVPLQWDETGYGFYYGTWKALKRYNSGNYNKTIWGEYALMDVTTSDYDFLKQNVHDRKYERSNGAESGRFFYVDCSETPGVVANLRFEGQNLCLGSRMFVSAWVNNLGNPANTAPNLNFELVGVNSDGSESVFAMYTTGDLEKDENTARGFWHQIFFEVDVPAQSFADYRLRIVNNAQSNKGNDFAVDEVAVYMEKPTFSAYQSQASCSSSGDGVALLRIDPEGIKGMIQTNQDFYYQFQDVNSSAIALTDYVAGVNNYGVLKVPKRYDNYPTYAATESLTGLEVYQQAIDRGDDVSSAFYTTEKDIDDNERVILYVYHHGPLFQPGETYKCVIAASNQSLAEDQEYCGQTSTFTMKGKAEFVLNNQEQTDTVASGMCPGDKINLSLNVYGTSTPLGVVALGTCYSDWLEGSRASYSDFGAIKQALEHFREVYPNSSKIEVIRDAYTQADEQLLSDLYGRGVLELHAKTITRSAMNGTAHYVVFPIPGTAVTTDDKSMTICPMDIELSLTSKVNENYLQFGYQDEQGVPTTVREASRVVRMNVLDANTSTLEIPVYTMHGSFSLNELASSKVYMISTSDENLKSYCSPDETNSLFTVSGATQANGQIVMSLQDRQNGLTFSAGNRYDFKVVKEFVDDCDGIGLFSVVVVPDAEKWSPKEGSHSWHVDRNWTMIDEQGNELTSGSGYVPCSWTNVLIPESECIPILEQVTPSSSSCSAVTLSEDAQNDIAWDINFVANSCKNIHIGAGGMLSGQHYLNYEKAWVDMRLSTSAWNLIAPPFEDMVVGDMYIPRNGDTTGLFEEVAAPDSRKPYEFWTSLYNSTNTERDRYNRTTTYGSAEWTVPHNALNTPLVTAHGYSVKVKDNQNNQSFVVVRLPKTATTYYYYGSYGEQTNMFETIARTANGHRLAGGNDVGNDAVFDSTALFQQAHQMHLMANPYLAQLDMQKFMSDAKNKLSLLPKYALIDESNRTYTMFDLTNQLSNTGRTNGVEYLIEPMTSFMVYMDNACSTPQLHVLPSMVKDYKASGNSSAQNAPMAIQNKVLVIRGVRNGEQSSCVVATEANGSNGVDDSDTRLVMLKSGLTPSSIYTSSDNVALSINLLKQIQMVPLCYTVMDTNRTRTLEVTFSGVEEFDGELSLFDAQTNVSTTLTEGLTLSLPQLATCGQRYYICYQSDVATGTTLGGETGNLLISQSPNEAVALQCSDVMQTIRIYGINGQLIEVRSDVEDKSASFTLPEGGYIFDVESVNGTYRQKYIVH